MARPSKPWYWEARACWATNLNGKRYTAPKTIGPKDQLGALTWHKSIVDGAVPVRVGDLQVHQLAERYLAWDVKRIQVGQRNEAAHNASAGKLTRVCATVIDGVKIGSMPVATISSRHLKRMLLEWQSEGLSANYVRDLGAVFKAMFNWAVHEELVAAYPFTKTPLPRVPKAAARFASRREAAQWLRFLWRSGKRDFAFLQRCLIHTGARPSELTRATRDEVSWGAWTEKSGHKGAIIVRTDWKNSKKSNELRRVYLPASLCRGLRRRLEGPTPASGGAGPQGRTDRAGHIFTSARGIAWTATNLSTVTIRARRAGIEQGLPFADDGPDALICYRWRHTAASTLLNKGVPIAVVGKLLGTSAAMIASTYGHILNDSLADAASQL
jgi:integrase